MFIYSTLISTYQHFGRKVRNPQKAAFCKEVFDAVLLCNLPSDVVRDHQIRRSCNALVRMITSTLSSHDVIVNITKQHMIKMWSVCQGGGMTSKFLNYDFLHALNFNKNLMPMSIHAYYLGKKHRNRIPGYRLIALVLLQYANIINFRERSLHPPADGCGL